jgi:ABC-type Fe3+-hydroxamate transport system substrate-binding protein
MSWKYLISTLLMFVAAFTVSAQVRIVSLAPSITQNIQLLGKESTIIGCTSYCPLSAQSKAQVVASAIDANIEKIISLKPDYVLTTGLTKPQTIQTLEKVGIKVKVFPYPKSYADISEQFKVMATLTQSEKHATEILEQQQLAIERFKSQQNRTKKVKIFFEIGANPLFTVIRDTYMHEMIELAGAQNIGADMNQGSITRESVIIRNPDVIFIATMGEIGEEEKNTWSRFGTLSAVKQKQIFLLDAEKACTPTPTNFIQTVEEMIRLISNQK